MIDLETRMIELFAVLILVYCAVRFFVLWKKFIEGYSPRKNVKGK